MTEQQQVNLNIIEGDAFFAHEASINYNPTQITLDFKCITPRTDPRSKKPSFQLKHNVVMIEPWQAKALLSVLNEAIQKYEKDFGKLKKPKAIEKAEKMRKDHSTTKNKTTTQTPTYFG